MAPQEQAAGGGRASGGEPASPPAGREAEARRSAPSRVGQLQGQAQRGESALANLQGQVTFEDVAICFSPEEWSMLEGWQKKLHQEVMKDNCALLLSLGHMVPSGAFLSLIQQQEVTVEGHRPQKRPSGDGDDEKHPFTEDVVEAEGPWDVEGMTAEDAGCLSPSHSQEGEYRSSLHLCALMKLVKEIPDFLYGHAAGTVDSTAPAGSSKAEEEGQEAGDVATNTEDTLAQGGPLEFEKGALQEGPCQSRERKNSPEAEPAAVVASVKADAALGRSSTCDEGEAVGDAGRPGPPDSHSGDSLTGSAAGDPEQKSSELEAGEHLPKEAPADLECWKEGVANELDSPLGTSGSVFLSNGCPVKERGLPQAGGGRPACRSTSRLSSPNGAQETTVEEKPLQGLLRCLKDLIVHQPLPSHQASRKVSTGRGQEAPQHKRREVGSGSPPIRVKTETPEKEPPPCAGSSSLVAPASSTSSIRTAGGRTAGAPEKEEGTPIVAVKTEQVAGSPPLQHLDGAGHSFSAHRAAEEERTAKETGGPDVKIKTEDDPPLETLMGCLKEAPEEKRDPQARLSNQGISLSSGEPGLWVPYPEDWSPATSPLHGLLNCLREIPIPGPEPARVSAGKAGGGEGKERRKGGRRGPLELCGDWTAPGNLCEVSSCSRTPPASTLSEPLVEAKHSPLPLSGGYVNSNLGQDAESRKPEVGPQALQECKGLDTPSQGLERHSKGLPLSLRSQPASPAISSSISGSPDRLPRWTPEPGRWARKEEGLRWSVPPLQGLERRLRDPPSSARSQPPSPALSASFSSSSDGLHRWTPEAGKQARKEAGLSQHGTPLPGLDNCPKALPGNPHGQSFLPASGSSFGSSSNGPCSLETVKEEGIPPLQGLENCLKEIPVSGNSLPNCFAATSFFCTQKLRKADDPSRQPWAGGGPKDSLPRCPTSISGCAEAGVESSPLHRLMSCLKEVPIRRPSYLNTPSISSASSSCSESERDQQSPEGWPLWDSSQAKRKATANSACLRGLAHYLAEIPASPRHRSQVPAGNSQGSSEHGEWDGPKNTTSVEEGRLTESSPLQGLLRCLKEINARGPEPGGSSASDAGGATRHWQPKEETGHGRASQEGMKERAESSASPASAALSSPQRGTVPGSPALEAGRGHRGGVSVSLPVCATGKCTGMSGNGGVCLLNGRSPSHRAQRQNDSQSPKSGMKRSLLTAKGGDQVPGPPSCAFSSGASGESENPPKKRCPSLNQSPPVCRWGEAEAPERQAEDGNLGPGLSQKLDRLSEDMSAICRDVSRLQSHMDRLEQDARGWVLELAALHMENRCLSEYVRRMESRCRTLEARSRRNNLRLLGLPEGVEGSDVVSFLQKTLPAMLGLQLDSPPLEIESARRVQGGVAWEPNGRPRALVFRLLRFADKATILQAARTQPLSYAGTQVTILPDFCSSPSRRRRVPFGTFRRTRWAADLCFAPRHSSCYTWAQGLREPLATSGPLAGEREGRVPKRVGSGSWNTGPLAGTAHHGVCRSTGSPE